jgi:hypothetical protein
MAELHQDLGDADCIRRWPIHAGLSVRSGDRSSLKRSCEALILSQRS